MYWVGYSGKGFKHLKRAHQLRIIMKRDHASRMTAPAARTANASRREVTK